MITLPKTVITAREVDPKLMLIYGPPKVGKTTILAALPNCLVIDTEDGSDYISALKLKVSKFDELREACAAIVAAGRPYDFVALDTITRVEDWCETRATQLYKETVIGKSFSGKTVLELPQGSGYFWLRRAFDEVLAMIIPTAKRVILVGHLREKFLGGKDAKLDSSVSTKDLDLTGKIKQIACSRSDAIGYVHRDPATAKLFVSFESTEQINCGSRCAHLKGKKMEFEWSAIYTSLKII